MKILTSRSANACALVCDVIVAIAGLVFSVGAWDKLCWPKRLILVVASVALLFLLIKASYELICAPRLTVLERKTNMAERTFGALQSANDNRTKEIMRYTYGKVADWNPINYYKNVLTYDVHEQIRSILVELKQLVINLNPEMNGDMVAVDLIYCYPCDLDMEGKTVIFPVKETALERWHLISSEDSDHGGNVHSYLQDKTSFYYSVSQNGYVYKNDKCAKDDGITYIEATRDSAFYRLGEKKKTTGSIVGLRFTLENNDVEKLGIYAMLTISTFGRKLCNEKKRKNIDDFYSDFHTQILCSFKSLLIGEFAQKFIRHEVRNGQRCPTSGAKVALNDGEKFYQELSEEIADLVSKKEKSWQRRGKKCFCHPSGGSIPSGCPVTGIGITTRVRISGRKRH